MIEEAKLIQLIYASLKNQNNQIRKKAETELIFHRQNSPNQFFIKCSQIVSNITQNQFIRQCACTILVGAIRFKTPNSYYLWDQLTGQTKQCVKMHLLNTLIDQNPKIMRASANAISYIAVIQIPRNEWLDLVDSLVQNTKHHQLKIRKASIITIGQICQNLNQSNLLVNQNVSKQFLQGILQACNQIQNITIFQTAIAALRNSLVFLKPVICQQKYRSQIFKVLHQNFSKYNQSNIIYEALFQFCKVGYQYLEQYLQRILQIVLKNIKKRNQQSLLALQIIDTIGCQYIQKVLQLKNRTYKKQEKLISYLNPIQNQLIPEIMNCLLIQNQSDLQFPQLRNQSLKVLETLVQIGDKQTLQILQNGVKTCLSSSQPGIRQASCVILSSLCFSKYKQDSISKIKNYLSLMIDLLNSQDKIVVLNTLNGLSIISEHHPIIFYNDPHFQQILQLFFNLLDSGIQGVAMLVLIIFRNISDNQKIQNICQIFTNPNLFLNRIFKYFQVYIDDHQGQNKQFTEKSVIIIVNCLLSMKNPRSTHKIIEFLIAKYHLFIQKNVISALLSILQSAILSLEGTTPIQAELNSICNVIDLKLRNSGVDYELVGLISSLVISFGHYIQHKIDFYWMIMIQGINLINNPQTFKLSLNCIGDFSRVYGDKLRQKQLQILGRLLDLIYQNIQRQLKINILTCIADLLMSLGPTVQVHLRRIVKMLDFCFQAVYQLLGFASEKQYVQQLQNNIIDLQSCLMFSLNSSAKYRNSVLLDHYPIVATFIVETCKQSTNPKLDYLKNCLFFIFDTATLYWQSSQINTSLVKNVIESNQIRYLIQLFKQNSQDQDSKQLLRLINQKFEIKIESYC